MERLPKDPQQICKPSRTLINQKALQPVSGTKTTTARRLLLFYILLLTRSVPFSTHFSQVLCWRPAITPGWIDAKISSTGSGSNSCRSATSPLLILLFFHTILLVWLTPLFFISFRYPFRLSGWKDNKVK